MKEQARITNNKTRDIISNGAGAENNGVLASLPSERTLKRDIQRHRQRANILDPAPAPNDAAFVIPQQYCVTTTGMQFLQVNSHLDGRLLMFGTQDSLQF